MIKRLVWILAVLLISSQVAQAIDTGTLSGTLRIGDEVVELREVYAHFHDNAEGLLDRPKEMRIVLSDRPTNPPGIPEGHRLSACHQACP